MDTDNPEQVVPVPDAPAAGDRMTLTQLAQQVALDRRQRTQAAAPGPGDQPTEPQPADPPPATPDDQSPPAEPQADPSALWNQTSEPSPDPGDEGEPAETTEPEAQAPGEDLAAEPTHPESNRKLLKRVNRLTAELRQTQEKLQQANALLAKPAPATEDGKPGGAPTAPPANRYAAHPEVRQIETELGQLNTYLDWCRQNQGGGEFKQGEQTQYFDEDAVRRIQNNVELRRTELLSERGAIIAELKRQDAGARAQCEQLFAQAYAGLEKGTSAEAREYQLVLQQAPWFLNYPNGKLWIADAIRGRIAREAAMRKAGKLGHPAGASPAPVATRPVAAAGPVAPGRRGLRTAQEAFQKSGSATDLARVIAAERAAEREAR